MNEASHPVPAAWTTVAVEQIRLVGLRFRAAGAALLAVGVLVSAAFAWVTVSGNARIVAIHDTLAFGALARPGHASVVPPLQPMDIPYSPAISVVIAALALLLPLAMWQDEPPAQRGYHLAMPMRASTHTLIRVLAGWFWMMVITTLYLAFLVACIGTVNSLSSRLPVHLRYVAAWEWLVPFTTVTIAYLVASAAAVGTRRPLVWLGGTVILYVGGVVLLGMLQFNDAAGTLAKAYTGHYGAAAAMAGQVEGTGGMSSLARWLGSTAIWGFAAAALLFTVAHRRAEA